MPDPIPLRIGGAPVITLEPPHRRNGEPGFVRALLLPGRGMMLLQATASLPSVGEIEVLAAPSVERAAELLSGGPEDFCGNMSVKFGAPFLIPFANRIRGTYSPDSRTIETTIMGQPVTLPANGGGSAVGAEKFAIHGLILSSPVDSISRDTGHDYDSVTADMAAGDFGGYWLSAAAIRFRVAIHAGALVLEVTAQNVGRARMPIGIGWHPYFSIPSGERAQARLHVPASRRIVVNNYDEVLPTGELRDVANTNYDFSAPEGAPLRDMYLDDCYVELRKTPTGATVMKVIDPVANYGLNVTASSPHVKAIQTCAPPDRPFVAVEPQFNWANPYGQEWVRRSGERHDTGMVELEPGASVSYEVRLTVFVPNVVRS